MPIDRDFWKKLATKHGLASEQAEAIANNQALMDELNEMALRRDDAKQLIEQTASEKRAAEQARTDALKKYQENVEWFGKNQSALQELEQLRQRAGNDDDGGNGNGRQQIATPAIEDIRKEIQKAQRDVYSLNKELIKADREYQRQFGKPLPIEELEEVALKPENAGRNIRDIFSDWVAPQLEQKRSSDVESRIKEERERAYAEGLAKGRLREPSQNSPDEVSPLYAPRPKKEDTLDDVTLQSHFVETYEKNMEAERVGAG